MRLCILCFFWQCTSGRWVVYWYMSRSNGKIEWKTKSHQWRSGSQQPNGLSLSTINLIGPISWEHLMHNLLQPCLCKLDSKQQNPLWICHPILVIIVSIFFSFLIFFLPVKIFSSLDYLILMLVIFWVRVMLWMMIKGLVILLGSVVDRVLEFVNVDSAICSWIKICTILWLLRLIPTPFCSFNPLDSNPSGFDSISKH